MFIYLEARKKIAEAQRKLEATLQKEFPRQAVKDIGYPGNTERDATVFTNGRYWFWSKDHRDRKVANPRRLNWFGLFSEDALEITVEVNTAYEGRNNQAGGFFAQEVESGVVYLLHSGRVGGGTTGVGKNAFRAWAGEPLIEVIDSDGNIRDGSLVMPVEGVAAGRSAVRYVDTVNQFKLAVRTGEIKTKEFRRRQKTLEDFYPEGRGRRKGRRSSEIDYISRHGDIVDALRKWRQLRPMPQSSRFVKNVLIDMGIVVGETLVEVFEVKTSSVRSSIYAALGQLMVHSPNEKCRRVMVLPQNEVLADDVSKALKRLGIDLLHFKLDKKSAAIIAPYKI
jgi:hypothetical protein